MTPEEYVKFGFKVVPIEVGNKRCVVTGWPDRDTDELLRQFKPGDGIGIVPKVGYAAGDIDTYNEDHAEHMHDTMKMLIGDYVYRIGRSPKWLIPCVCPGLEHKLISKRYKDNEGRIYAIELLSCRQQYVTEHIHPGTNKPYKWYGADHAPVYSEQPLIPIDIWKNFIFPEFEKYAEGVLGLELIADEVNCHLKPSEREWTTGQDTYNHTVQITDLLKQYGYDHCGSDKWSRPGHRNRRNHTGSVSGNTYHNFSTGDILTPDMTHTAYDMVLAYSFNGDIAAMDKHVDEYIISSLSSAGFGGEIPEGASAESPVDQIIGQLPTDTIIPPHHWFPLVYGAQLSPVELEAVFKRLASLQLIEGTYRSIKAEYKQRVIDAETAATQAEVAASQRYAIEWNPSTLNEMVKHTEQGIMRVGGRLEYFKYGDMISHTVDLPPNYHRTGVKTPNQVHIRQYNRVSMHSRIEDSCIFTKVNEDGITKQIAVPDKVIGGIIENPHSEAPTVSGLVTHPVVTHTGRIINQEGIDTKTALMSQYGGMKFSDIVPYTREQAYAAMLRVRQNMFSESVFLDDTHGWIGAVALVATAIERKLIAECPMFAVISNMSASGKTAILEMAHIIVTGRRLSPVSLSNGDEMEKQIISMLITSPSMIAFDNINDGTEVRGNKLAKLITSSSYRGRVLGESKSVDLPTNCMVAATGNNITFSSDLVNRIVTIKVTSDMQDPETKEYESRRLINKCIAVRDEVIRDICGIISGYHLSGEHVPVRSRFPDWEDLVASPIKWATGYDVTELIRSNKADSSEYGATEDIIYCIKEIYGVGKMFTATDIITTLDNNFSDKGVRDTLREALCIIAPKSLKSSKSLGWVFKKLKGKYIGGYSLEDARTEKARGYVLQKR